MSSTSGGDLTNTKVIVQKKSNQNNPENVNSLKETLEIKKYHPHFRTTTHGFELIPFNDPVP
ncbi:MAG: hypothetical protein DRR19_26045 [Candidatus Parabeggiatoa sp. nov. 1]|nr:MAG: hypothetical protein DRR19_26045 [Gammaproteobacteria bacterium]